MVLLQVTAVVDTALRTAEPAKWTDVSQAISAWFGVLIAIVGFGAVVYQIRQVREAVRADTHGRIYEHALEVQKLFVEHPQFREYFYGGAAMDPSAEEYARLLAFTELLADYLEHISLQCAYVPDHVRRTWENYTCRLLMHSPVLDQFLSDNEGLYSTEFMGLCNRVRGRRTTKDLCRSADTETNGRVGSL